MLNKLLITSLILIMAAPSLMADRRKYVWTYGTQTTPENNSELEFYQTTKLDKTDSWEYRIEVEHGLSSNWDFSVYQIFAQKEGEGLKWDAVQFRSRYRLAAPGAVFGDPVLYLEYRRKTDLTAQNKAEAKLLLGHDFDRCNIAINPVYEFFWAPGDPVHEVGLDVGFSYEFSYKFSAGVESTSRREFLKDADDEVGSYFGPTISFASGTVFYTFGYVWGLTDDSNDARVRFLMGVGL
jgi:hypothetical protein